MTIPYRGTYPPIDDDLLSAYLDGQVTPDERAAVEAALAADPAARARLADLRATVTLLRALPQPAPRRTFILTSEQAAAIRPVRVPWLTRLFPTVAALSAVAAVLCLALIAGDLATGGFATKQRQVVSSRPASEAVKDAAGAQSTGAAAIATAPAATAAPLPAPTSLPAAAAANAPAPAAAATAARSASAPSQAAAPIAPTAGVVQATATGAPLVAPTAVANVQTPPSAASAPASGGAVVTKETHRIPVALVRAGEIALALLAVAGVALAVSGRRARHM